LEKSWESVRVLCVLINPGQAETGITELAPAVGAKAKREMRFQMPVVNTIRSAHLDPGGGEKKRVITDLVTIKATSADTADAYTLYEAETPPSGGFPPHLHRYEDETFYVLESSYSVLLDDRELELRAGAYLYVPRGTIHGYVNTGSQPARMLVLVTPGGIHEKFLDEIGDEADRPAWEPDMAKVLAVAPKYGIDFLASLVINETPTEPSFVHEPTTH
jgi:quercetin dioxygenase-like cupin family protein